MIILKIRFFHVTKGPNIGFEPNFHNHKTTNAKDDPGQPQVGPFLTLGYMAAPLQNGHFGKPFFFGVRKGPNISIKSNVHGHTTSNG